jgi:very-short-patch-repair endonuclease
MSAGKENKDYLHHILNEMFGEENVVAEYKFHPIRRWRFDWAIPEAKLAIEYDGIAAFIRPGAVSRHGSITGMTGDCEKYNQARIHGWTILRFTALYFKKKDCDKHKLTHPRDTIMQTITRMQEEKENKV